ncbi:MAG: HAMP domain-containing histidine kinase [Hymenobacteraceae bacterium]|nr:HAMP domain-containing histidine kinase [Hymenobacteraceae bacterium]
MRKDLRSPQDQLEQLQQEFEEFAYIVSHDLKAPIRAISNLSSWIEEDLAEGATGDVEHNMQLLRNRTQRLERMIDALLQYSRVTRQHLEVEPTDVNELVKEVMASALTDSNMTLHVPSPLPVLHTYKAKLAQVFGHLLQNSANFCGGQPVEVTVTAQDAGDFYLFRVQDTAGGVPEEALGKIFSLFYTVAPKDAVNTAGAGLAITKKIIQFTGGSITAEPHIPKGLVIRFTWPKTIHTENQEEA